MSKIPQGEWNAIAARYRGGESISKIARSYGCTPPAIHYILKRHRVRPGDVASEPAPGRVTEFGATGLVRAHPAAPAPARLNGDKWDHGAPAVARPAVSEAPPAASSAGEKFTNGVPRLGLIRASTPEPGGEANARLARQAATATPAAAAPPTAPSPPPHSDGLPGLDNNLHHRAETAIALFRTSFEAALTEASPAVRENLRQAANDLMRVAARTTIVLDRHNTTNESSAARTHNYPRSPLVGEDIGKGR
jgi:hypothetical protein